MLPYRAQGAAMAIEDAVVLGGLLSGIRAEDDLPGLLRAYQTLRLPRTAETQKSSKLNQFIFHLPDGPEQVARDAEMKMAMQWEKGLMSGQNKTGGLQLEEGSSCEGNMNQWADRSKNERQFGYDAFAAVEEWWERSNGI
ncbi:hypothetical protein RSOLAG1IB_09220 [Rhizoctonia solani AG-1 IB]|uniref:FAD-binding domain-containing protein n=1 Tax=Thanatephorus cucumeris (strain AG1-IB / isolate 7/3/14) TaxID=1108050 RepID=A0A0B7FPP1_THACB|nr:hypothetical protein RSOLAG1IB_09220 [Rhizoctonia solani AG-1 IB]